ncbi:MAG: hypothetical protein FJ137_22545, partial [Deltaproteobacteria bacterium]|nr:hypothetical protein [Deltaproteobacteria bacterium]
MSNARAGVLLRAWDAIGIRGKQFAASLLVVAAALCAGGVVADRRAEAAAVDRIERELDRVARTAAVALLHPTAGATPDGELGALAKRLGAATTARVTLI